VSRREQRGVAEIAQKYRLGARYEKINCDSAPFLDCARNDKIDNQVSRRSSADALRKAVASTQRYRERNCDDHTRLDYRVAVTNAYAMLPLSSNQLMVLREQPEAMPA